MKKLPLFLGLPFCLMAFFSCADSEGGGALIEERARIDVEWAHVESTRAAITGQFLPDGSVFGITMLKEDVHDVAVQCVGENFIIEYPIYVIGEHFQPFYAYYPKNRIIGGKVKMTPGDDVDYMWCATQISRLDPKAFILFKHAQARITLQLKKYAKSPGKGYIKELCMDGVAGKWMDVRNGRIDTVSHVFTSHLDTILSEEETIDVEWLVAPDEFKDSTRFITCLLDGRPRKAAIPANKWKAGYHYTYSVMVGDTTIIGDKFIDKILR